VTVVVAMLRLQMTLEFAGNVAAPRTPTRTAEMFMSFVARVVPHKIAVADVVVTVAPVPRGTDVSNTLTT
jgi:hypothetical protein